MRDRWLTLGIGITAVAAAAVQLRTGGGPLPLALLSLALGAAVVHVVHVVRGAHAAAEPDARGPGSPALQVTSLTGPTRLEVHRLRHELDLMTSQLRREASSRQSAEERLIEAFRAKETFLATMSHELRTPLSQIIGYSELLIEEAEDGASAELTGEVSRIHQAAMNLFDIIGNALDQSEINAGKVAVDPEPVEPLPFTEQLTQSFAAQARARGNTLRLRCPEGLAPIVTDRGKLHTILRNLLNNACKFTEGGTIRLSVALDASSPTPTYVFAVRDTGIGIRPEDMARLFQPFAQVDGSRTRRFDGAGLGLAVSRHFAAILGGELLAESTPGQGSTFTLRLPQAWLDLRSAGVIVRSFGA